MPVTVTRTNSNLIGSPSSPQSIAAGGTQTSTAGDMTTPAGVINAAVDLSVIAGTSAPTTAITVRFFFSLDGTNYAQDGADISITPAASTTYPFRYEPPDAASKVQVVVINGATNAITAWCQFASLAVS
jgi:hypothetical protein